MLTAFSVNTQALHRSSQRKKGFEIALKADFGRGDKVLADANIGTACRIVASRPDGCDAPCLFPCRTRFISHREQ